VFTRVRDKLAGFVVENIVHAATIRNSPPEVFPQAMDKWRLRLWNLAYSKRKLIRRRSSSTVTMVRRQSRNWLSFQFLS
jgi:hypothetical protein